MLPPLVAKKNSVCSVCGCLTPSSAPGSHLRQLGGSRKPEGLEPPAPPETAVRWGVGRGVGGGAGQREMHPLSPRPSPAADPGLKWGGEAGAAQRLCWRPREREELDLA